MFAIMDFAGQAGGHVDIAESYNFHGPPLLAGVHCWDGETLDSQPSMLNIFADFLE